MSTINSDVWDNTGGSSAEAKPEWYEAQTFWPVGPIVSQPYRGSDPRRVLGKSLNQVGRDGYVIVKAAEIKAIIEMRVCRSTRDFDRDEDGPLTPMTAHCIHEAGHVGHHGNGYYTWSARIIPQSYAKEQG